MKGEKGERDVRDNGVAAFIWSLDLHMEGGTEREGGKDREMDLRRGGGAPNMMGE